MKIYRIYHFILSSILMGGSFTCAGDATPKRQVRLVVAGQVLSPGPHTVCFDSSLVDVIIKAGGCSEKSSRKVEIIRNRVELWSYKIRFDPVKEIITFEALKNSPKVPQLKNGDIVMIREGAFPLTDWRRWSRDQAAKQNSRLTNQAEQVVAPDESSCVAKIFNLVSNL